MNAIERLEQWHRMIKPSIRQQEIDNLAVKMMVSEIDESLRTDKIGSLIKEYVDVIVTAKFCMMNHSNATTRQYAQHQFDLHFALIRELGIDPMRCLEVVNESNFSKLIIANEIEKASEHFAHIGIDVEIISLDGGLMGCYSSHDQVVNGKRYEANKLMKSHNYSEIDEAEEWWV